MSLTGCQVIMRKMWARRLADQSEILTPLRKEKASALPFPTLIATGCKTTLT